MTRRVKISPTSVVGSPGADPCEWNPSQDRPAEPGEAAHAPAAVVLGDGKWRLCWSCSCLRMFGRYRKRIPIVRVGREKKQNLTMQELNRPTPGSAAAGQLREGGATGRTDSGGRIRG